MPAIGDPTHPSIVLFPRDHSGWDAIEDDLARRLAGFGRYVTDGPIPGRTDGSRQPSDPVHVVARDTGVLRLLDRIRTDHPPRLASVALLDPPPLEDVSPIELGVPTLIVHDRRPDSAIRARTLSERIPGSRCVRLDGPDRGGLLAPAVLAIGLDLAEQRARFRTVAAADPLGWFDQLYRESENGAARIPWDLGLPDPLLRDWLTRRPTPDGERAIVVGCGLGRDAELVAENGYDTTAFDISETAIRLVRQRFPDSSVNYRVADLLDFPTEWTHGFDLVVECITVQALPASLRPAAIRNVARLVRPGGTLIVVALRPPDDSDELVGPPWPLAREEIEAFATDGLRPVRIERRADDAYTGRRERWRAEFRRSSSRGPDEPEPE